MGQSPSKPIRGKSVRRRSLRSPLPRKSKSNLSHTFSISEIHENVELLNVNYASEEQLMTLPGISRQIAQAIVDHRQAIGRFKKLDDLALVSGMGAEKLSLIRAEICVGRRLASSPNSRTQSLDSVRSSESGRVQFNINTVNIFQLQCIPGLNQELAANIVDYRKRKGLFKSLDDLIKVKGINTIRLSSIKSHLSLTRQDDSPAVLNGINHSSNGVNGGPPILHVSKSALINATTALPRTPGHRKSLSVPVKCTTNLSNGFSMAPVNDIFDLLSAYSRRPIIEEEFTYQRDGKPAYRVATWNLHQLSNDKANNPGFREVVCRTILENKFSILGIQEVLEEEALKTICDELNLPTLRRVCEWKENSKKWQYHITPGQIQSGLFFGILYDEFSVNIHIEIQPFNNEIPIPEICHTEESTEREKVNDSRSEQYSKLNCALIDCKVNKTHIILVNCHLVGEISEYSITILGKMIDKLLINWKNIVIIGDFHSLKNVEDLASCYTSVIDPACSTFVDMSGGAPLVSGRAGMLVPQDSLKLYADRSGIVRSGLSHLAIPRGWTWGGPASLHCPIWAEFFTYG